MNLVCPRCHTMIPNRSEYNVCPRCKAQVSAQLAARIDYTVPYEEDTCPT
jgi:uncharacterized paraquat-inducible protein A